MRWIPFNAKQFLIIPNGIQEYRSRYKKYWKKIVFFRFKNMIGTFLRKN